MADTPALAQILHAMPPTARSKSTARTNLGKRLASVTDAPTIEPDDDDIVPKKLRLSDVHHQAHELVPPEPQVKEEEEEEVEVFEVPEETFQVQCGYTFPNGMQWYYGPWDFHQGPLDELDWVARQLEGTDTSPACRVRSKSHRCALPCSQSSCLPVAG